MQINKNQAQEIIDRYIKGESSYDLADRYNLWQTSICNIIRGQTWKCCVRPSNIKDIILSRNERKGTRPKDLPLLTNLQEDVIIASLLGDGSVTKPHSIHNKGNSYFVKSQSLERIDYLNWHSEIMGSYSSGVHPVYSKETLGRSLEGKITRTICEKHLIGYSFWTFSHPNLTYFRNKWYPQGVKQIPSDLELNPQRIAIWYFDDGSNNEKQRNAVLCTQGFTFAEAEFLCEKFKPFNLLPKICKIKSYYSDKLMPQLKFSKNSYDDLITLMKPYMLWDCFSHKIQWHRARKQWETSGKFTKEQIEQIIEMRKTHTSRQIAEQFNVHVNTIYSIVSGRSWAHMQQG